MQPASSFQPIGGIVTTNQPYRILTIQATTAADDYGNIVRTKLIKYMVGVDGPFTYVVPIGQDTPNQIQAALLKEAQSIAALRGAQ